MTIHITRYVSEAERQKVQDAVKANDSKATHAALAALPDAGYIELAKRKTPLKYAYARPTSGGRLVTVIATQPIMALSSVFSTRIASNDGARSIRR